MRLLILILVLSGAPSVRAEGQRNPLDDNVDKGAHFGLSVVLVESCLRAGQIATGEPQITMPNRIASSAFTFAVGVGKEVYDKKRGGDFSYADIAADALGIITGNILLWNF